MSSISKNYFLNIIILLTGILFPVITFPYISRVLMPEYIGKVTFAQSITYYFITLSLLGIPIYGTRELAKNKNDLVQFKKIFTELFLVGIIGSIISYIFLIIILRFNNKLYDLKDLIYLFGIQVIFSFLNLDYIFIVLENHKRRMFRSLVLRIISIILMFILIKTYKDYKIYVYILVVPEILMRILDFISIKKYISIKNKLNIRRHMKSLCILFISSLSVTLYVSLDSTMLGFLLGDKAVGLYTSASKMTRILIPIIISLDTVIGPQLINHIKERDVNKIYNKIDIFLDFNFIVGLQFVFLLFLISKDMILLFSGEKFMEAASVMKIMLPIIIFIPIGSFMSGKILISHNLEKLSLKFNMIGMLANGILNLILIPYLGILGAAFATVFTEGIICILKTLRVKKLYPDYQVITKDRIKYLLFGVGITLFIYKIKKYILGESYFENIFYVGLIYSTFYVILLFITKDKILIIGMNRIRQTITLKVERKLNISD